MRLDEIINAPLLEMAYKRAEAVQIIRGLEDPINLHLIKLAAVGQNRTDDHWRRELRTWLAKIARIRLKPSNKPADAKFYYGILFEGPYGINQVHAVDAQIQLLADNYVIIDNINTENIAKRLQAFHKNFADRCATGQLDFAEIKQLAENFGGL